MGGDEKRPPRRASEDVDTETKERFFTVQEAPSTKERAFHVDRRLAAMFAVLLRLLALTALVGLSRAHGGTDHSPKNCLCECPDGRRDALLLTGDAQCTTGVCRASASCIYEDGLDRDAEVKATPIDCTCHCCDNSSCREEEYAYFNTNGVKSECNEAACREQDECSALPYVEAIYADGSVHNSETASSSSGLSGGAIAGIVIGVIAGVALIAVAAYMLLPRKKSTISESWTDMHDQMHSQQQQQPRTEVGMGDYLQ